MKFSTRTLYGLKAILVLASRFGEGSLSASQIAKKENISVAYLEQILHTLKKKGFVKSVRGPQGGYTLSKKPSEIPLDSLLYTLVGEASLNGGTHLKNPDESDEVSVAYAVFWNLFKSVVDKGLAEKTLKELIDEARRLKKGKLRPSHSFNI